MLEALDSVAWSVSEISVSTSQVSNVLVPRHTFAADARGMDKNLPSGEPVEMTVLADTEAGASLVYYCSGPGHRQPGMEGTPTIG